MNFYRTLIIIGLFLSLAFNVLGNNTKEMLFTSPVIYKPIIDLALSKNTKPLNKRQPTKIPEFKITMIISDFVPDNKEDKEQFDSFTKLSFKEINNIDFLIFKKNGLVQRINVITNKNSSKVIKNYIRNINSLLLKIPKQNKDYFKKTKDTIVTILKEEGFLASLPKGEYILTFKLELLSDGTIGDVYFSKYPRRHTFCFKKYYINISLWRNTKPRGILFAVTYLKDYISLASVFDKNKSNGFECQFYPDQGLKRYLLIKNGEPGDVTLWGKGGKNEKKVSLKEWLKLLHAPRIVAYFPGDWLIDVSTLKGYTQESACYWDDATKSPRYELVLSTSGGSFLCQFNFSSQLKLTDALYEEMLKKMKNCCVGNTVFESPVSFKSEIGSKSFGLSQDGITKEIVFLRDNLVLHITRYYYA